MDPLDPCQTAIVGVATEAGKHLYTDAARPIIQELAKGGQGLVRIATAPIRRLLMIVEHGDEKLARSLREKLQEVPSDRLVEPKVSVAKSAIEGWLTTEASEPDLAEMYAKLLAASMDAEKSQGAHPAYAQIIGQLIPDEAKLLRFLWGSRENLRAHVLTPPVTSREFETEVSPFCWLAEEAELQDPTQSNEYIENLRRLALVETWGGSFTRQEFPSDVKQYRSRTVALRALHESDGTFWCGHFVELTTFGMQFCSICLPGD